LQYYFILYVFILFKNWKFIATTKKKILTIFLLAVFFFIHITVLFIIDLTYNGLKLTKEVIKVKSESFEPTIYIVKTIGIFNIYEGAEIGYSKRFSPFYNKYYRTKNHLQVLLEDSSQIIIREYRYERPDSSKKILIPGSDLIKKEIKVIQINRSRLK